MCEVDSVPRNCRVRPGKGRPQALVLCGLEEALQMAGGSTLKRGLGLLENAEVLQPQTFPPWLEHLTTGSRVTGSPD